MTICPNDPSINCIVPGPEHGECCETMPGRHEERAINERTELAEKLGKLNTFLNGPNMMAIAEVDRILLLTQQDQMTSYLNTLNRRIARFT